MTNKNATLDDIAKLLNKAGKDYHPDYEWTNGKGSDPELVLHLKGNDKYGLKSADNVIINSLEELGFTCLPYTTNNSKVLYFRLRGVDLNQAMQTLKDKYAPTLSKHFAIYALNAQTKPYYPDVNFEANNGGIGFTRTADTDLIRNALTTAGITTAAINKGSLSGKNLNNHITDYGTILQLHNRIPQVSLEKLMILKDFYCLADELNKIGEKYHPNFHWNVLSADNNVFRMKLQNDANIYTDMQDKDAQMIKNALKKSDVHESYEGYSVYLSNYRGNPTILCEPISLGPLRDVIENVKAHYASALSASKDKKSPINKFIGAIKHKNR